MAPSFERSIKYLPYGDNLVKIGLVDPEIALLEGTLKRKKLMQAEHIERRACMPCKDRTGTVSGTVPAQNNVGSVRSRNIFCSGAGKC